MDGNLRRWIEHHLDADACIREEIAARPEIVRQKLIDWAEKCQKASQQEVEVRLDRDVAV